MILISYDISNDKLRSKFSKFLKKYGNRLQYSLFQIKNSERILNLIEIEIKNNFEKHFEEADSIYIYRIPKNCNITKYGYASHEDDEFIII